MCAFCGQINEKNICRECLNKIEKYEKAGIQKYTNKNFDLHIYLFRYEEPIREKIIEYKFKNKPYYYKTFAKILINNKKIYDILKSYDIITSVPLSKTRKKERGYNQTELIAKELSKNIKTLKYISLLEKVKNTVPQRTLNKEQRLKNLENAYKLKQKTSIENKKIIIFDDVFTTGTTANECAKTIKTIGKNKISILTIAKD